MDQEVLVKVESVSKKFCKDLKRSLWYGLQDITSELFGLKKKKGLRKDEFWAVSDVSFELKRGECLGLIGHNGAGKSTLLKILNGLIKPDKGRITMKGRIGALIELGAGFNPILTGRENVFNNGAVLGFSQKEIATKYKDIVEFAELEKFMDTPVQNYSSGMKVRLGFAVAAQLEPDVLIIDEVLAVGDVGFQVKCFNKINEIINKCVVIFVTHSMPNIGRLASRTILMINGITSIDSVNNNKAIEAYYSNFETEEEIIISEILIFDKIIFLNAPRNQINFGEGLNFEFHFHSTLEITNADIGIALMDQSLRTVGVYRKNIGNVKLGLNKIFFIFHELKFTGKNYYFSIEVNKYENELKKEVYGLFKNIGKFSIVNHPFEVDSVIYLDGQVRLND